MRHRWFVILALVVGLFSLPLLAKSSHASHSSKPKSTAGKTEHVSGHTTKNGMYVASYDRHPAGTAPQESKSSSTHSHSAAPPSYIYYPYKKNHMAYGYTPHSSVAYDGHGKIKRSGAAKDAFKREQPCPANGNMSGKCSGYVIDHVKPLECGGADAPSNMQWQTAANGKAKDKNERYCR